MKIRIISLMLIIVALCVGCQVKPSNDDALNNALAEIEALKQEIEALKQETETSEQDL